MIKFLYKKAPRYEYRRVYGVMTSDEGIVLRNEGPQERIQ